MDKQANRFIRIFNSASQSRCIASHRASRGEPEKGEASDTDQPPVYLKEVGWKMGERKMRRTRYIMPCVPRMYG